MDHITTNFDIEYDIKNKLNENQGEIVYDIDLTKEHELFNIKDIIIKKLYHTNTTYKYLIRDKTKLIIRRIVVCGNVDSGKSTLIGVLLTGKLDNGKGLVRKEVFNFKHEIETGRTSSISYNNLKLDINTNRTDILEGSKCISLIDVAGHEKYLKTTILGITGTLPDYGIIVIGSNMGISKMTKEHIGLLLGLKIPFIIVFTKLDLCPKNILDENLLYIKKLLKHHKKIPYKFNNDSELFKVIDYLSNPSFVPIFLTSNVNGNSIDLILKYLNFTPYVNKWSSLSHDFKHILIDHTYSINGIGTVITGTIKSGTIHLNDTLLLGPDFQGLFHPLIVKGIVHYGSSLSKASAGQTIGLSFKKSHYDLKNNSIHKGMILLDPSIKPKAIWEFEASIIVFHHSTTISNNYQPIIHCLNIRQSAKIIHISSSPYPDYNNLTVLRTGDKAYVRFKFMFRPEYIQPNMIFVFREGNTKGLGIITSLF